MSESLDFQHGYEGPSLTRRSFLAMAGALGAVSALGLSGCEGGGDSSLLPRQEVRTRLSEVESDVLITNPLEYMDTAYLSELFSALQAEVSDKETKVRAVQRSLRLIKDAVNGTEATAFEIDESGYYLTARHTLPDDLAGKFITIIDPYGGEETLVTESRVHEEADVAVVYAPNDRPPNATKGLQIDYPRLRDEQELWMIGLSTNQGLFRIIKYGRVDKSVYDEDTRVAVRGMIPFGGLSGSPITNSEGTIVGIESGAYPYSARTIEEYAGAVIAPLSYVQTLPNQPSITI